MARAIGIDLGTTSCCVYALQHGQPRPIITKEGSHTTPSVVAFGDGGQLLVGAAALRQAFTNPTRTVTGIKRILGRKLSSPQVEAVRSKAGFEIFSAANGDAWIRAGDRELSPQEIAGYLIGHLKARAEEYLRERVSQAVIGVPAFFDAHQRQATKDAAQLAGLSVERLVNEPTAAALAYGVEQADEQIIAVFDLGGGTFDVSILEVSRGVCEVVASSGETFLGGDDLDELIIEHLLEQFEQQTGIYAGDDAAALLRLKEAAKAIKEKLSTVRRTAVQLPFLVSRSGEPAHLQITDLQRDWLEHLAAHILDRLEPPCREALRLAGVHTSAVDRVILVGGMTRMPAVADRVRRIFKQRGFRDMSPDEVVARGAALQAAIVTGALKEVVLLDLTPHSLAIRVEQGRCRRVIERGSRLPCRAKQLLAPDPQGRWLVVEVYQGESDWASDNVFLGRFKLTGYTAERDPQVEVTFVIDTEGLLRVTARGTSTGRTTRVEIEPASGLSRAELAELVRSRDSYPPETYSLHSVAPGAAQPASFDAIAPPPDSVADTLLPRSRMPTEVGLLAQTRATVAGRAADAEPPPWRRSQTVPPPPVETGLADPLVGSTIDNRYVVERVLGEGAMGRVYLARHTVIDRRFAIKVLHEELAQQADVAQRFVQEAQAASAVAHPNVVEISDFGTLPAGSSYFVMEVLDGPTLAGLLEKEGMLSIDEACDIGCQIAAGLAAAHAKEIVHRDLKPENITLVDQGGKRLCKVLDFGIAKITSDNKNLTIAGMVLGTPQYMSPEQAKGEPVDHRTDIYALGAILYELIAGIVPFDAETVMGVLLQHISTPPISITDVGTAPDCPPELEALVLKCLEKDPDRRCQTMNEVAAELRQIRRQLLASRDSAAR